MKPPKCRSCGKLHWGVCNPDFANKRAIGIPIAKKPIVDKPVSVDKPQVVDRPDYDAVTSSILTNMVNNEKIRTALDGAESRRKYQREWIRKKRASA